MLTTDRKGVSHDTPEAELHRLRFERTWLLDENRRLWAERMEIITGLGIEAKLFKVPLPEAVFSSAGESADFVAGFNAAKERAVAIVRGSEAFDPLACAQEIRQIRVDEVRR
jgi:hypothetical protein